MAEEIAGPLGMSLSPFSPGNEHVEMRTHFCRKSEEFHRRLGVLWRMCLQFQSAQEKKKSHSFCFASDSSALFCQTGMKKETLDVTLSTGYI